MNIVYEYVLLFHLWQDMINCVGGLSVLMPILEQLALMTPDQQASDPAAGSDFITPDVTTPAEGDWVILPSNRASGLLRRLQYIFIFITATPGHTWKHMYFLFFCFRGTPGEESGGHLPVGAEAFPAETPYQPG